MAKSKEKKPKPKPPESAPTVIALRKEIAELKTKLAKRKEGATKDGKVNRFDPKVRHALKRVKRAQRRLADEAVRLKPKKAPPVEAAPVAAAPAEAAPAAEGEKKE